MTESDPTESDTTDLAAALAEHPFTQGLAPHQLEVITAAATSEWFPTGSWIMRIGQRSERLHLLRSGRAAIEIAMPGRDPLVVSTVHPGEVIGWSWLLAPHRAQFDVVALDLVHAVGLDAEALRAACESDHDLGYRITVRLARVLASRLEATRLQLVDVYGNPA